jgi:hypothetical protein
MTDTLSEDFAWPLPDEDADDLEIINSRSAELNEEAADVLEYQAPARFESFSPTPAA